jgi:hypothetical protein
MVRTKRQILRMFLLVWHRRFGVVLSNSPLVGAINYQDLLIAGCANALVLLNQNG